MCAEKKQIFPKIAIKSKLRRTICVKQCGQQGGCSAQTNNSHFSYLYTPNFTFTFCVPNAENRSEIQFRSYIAYSLRNAQAEIENTLVQVRHSHVLVKLAFQGYYLHTNAHICTYKYTHTTYKDVKFASM